MKISTSTLPLTPSCAPRLPTIPEGSETSPQAGSAYVTTGEETLTSLSVEVYGDERMVPAGSGTTFCGCSTGQCACGPGLCNVDADCSACFTATPVTTNVVIAAPPAIPESLDGTVATYLFLTEFGSGLDISTEVNECFVEVL